MAKYKAVPMNTTNGVEYLILRDFGGEWKPTYKQGYYKTKKGAMKEIIKSR